MNNHPRATAIFALTILSLVLLMPTVGRALTAPYPESHVITGMTWNFSTVLSLRKAVGSDIWAMTWGADGNLYGAWGDGGGFQGTETSKATGRASLGFARVTGTPIAGDTTSFAGQNLWGQAPEFAENQATFGGKVDDLISVGGVLYGQGGLWTLANCGCSDPTTKSSDNPTQRTLTWSSDLGKTWEVAPWTSSTEAGSSLQFGQNYSGAFDPAHIYYYYSGNINVDPTHSYLRRVLTSRLTENPATPGHFEYFTGVDASGAPLWSETATNASAIFYDPNSPAGAGTSVGAVYDAALGRYLVTEGHGNGTGQVGFFEGPQPWGPWATIAYYSDWGGYNETAGEGNGMQFPSKWISADGKTLWAVFSGADNGANGPDDFDSFNVVKVVLTTNVVAPQITAPTAETVLSPGEQVTAQGAGSSLSWSVRLSTASQPFAAGAGTTFAFKVPSDATASEKISITLTGSGGSTSRDYAIALPSGNSLVGYWKFDEGAGTSAADSSGNGNTGILVNGPSWATGKFGDALNFSAGRDFVQVPGSGNLANLYRSGLTVSAWIKPSSAAGANRDRIIDKDNNDVGWFFSMYTPDTIQFAVDQFTDTEPSRISTQAIALNEWQHVAATWDGSTNGSDIHLYVNGIPADSASVNGSGAAQSDSATPLVIGNRAVDLARDFDGVIDDVHVFNRVLTASEILNLATGAAAPDVTIDFVSTAKHYTLATAEVGTLAYIDRTYTLTGLSADLAGNTLIQVSNDDKTVTSSTYLQFSLDRASTVYICYSSSSTQLPAWLNDGTWVPTSEACDVNDGVASSRHVYKKSFSPGKVTLGGNRESPASGPSGYSNYLVVVVP